MDQAIVQSAKGCCIDAQSLGDAGSKALDCDIGGFCQRVDNLTSFCRLHIDSYASLVPVGAEKYRAQSGGWKRWPATGFVPLPDSFHLDDVGAEIAKILGA